MSGCWGVIRGFLYADPIEKVSNSGTRYVSARLKVKDKDKTVFWSISAFDEGANELLTFKGGDGVKVEGGVRGSTYVDKNGQTQIGFSIMTRLVEPYEPKQGGQKATHNSSRQAASQPSQSDGAYRRPAAAVAANGGPSHMPPLRPHAGHSPDPALDDDIPF